MAPRDFAEASIDLAGVRHRARASRTSSSRAARPIPSRGRTSRTSAAATSRSAARRAGTKFHDHNANGVRDTGDEGLVGLGDQALPRRRRQGPRGHGRRHHRQRRDRDRHRHDGRQRRSTSSPTSRTATTSSARCKQAELEPVTAERRHGRQGRLHASVSPRSRAVGDAFMMAGAGPPRQRLRQLPERHEVGHEVRRHERQRRPRRRRAGTRGRRDPPVRHRRTRQHRPPAQQRRTPAATTRISAPPGSYTACETVPAGYTQSFPTASTPSCDGCVAPPRRPSAGS